MAHKTLVNGTSYEISGGNTLVDGTAYSISGGNTLVDGTAYEIGFGTPIGDLVVGSSVYLKRGGASLEFLVVHQGLPSSMYDSSCDGTWLLMKDILSLKAWDRTDNNYAVSDIKASLDSEYIYYNVNASIKQVKIPYVKGTGSGGSVASGSSGLSARLFLLSATEVGYQNTSYTISLGNCLSYFSGTSANNVEPKRQAYYNGTRTQWWLRNPMSGSSTSVFSVYPDGAYQFANCSNSFGVRPAMILPSDAKIDENFNVIA